MVSVPCPRFSEIFAAVERGDADRGVIPLENSLAGSVDENLDLLVRTRLWLVGELNLRVEHCLLGTEGADAEQLREVRSHPKALEQCERWFAAHPRVTRIAVADTAEAARYVAAKRDPGIAAIASAEAGRVHGLTLLAGSLEDHPLNFTRFGIIARDPHPEPPKEVTVKHSITFCLPHVPDSLHAALGTLAKRGINLTKIESRPIAGEPFNYRFFADCVCAPPARGEWHAAFDALRAATVDLRLLGTYPSRS